MDLIHIAARRLLAGRHHPHPPGFRMANHGVPSGGSTAAPSAPAASGRATPVLSILNIDLAGGLQVLRRDGPIWRWYGCACWRGLSWWRRHRGPSACRSATSLCSILDQGGRHQGHWCQGRARPIPYPQLSIVGYTVNAMIRDRSAYEFIWLTRFGRLSGGWRGIVMQQSPRRPRVGTSHLLMTSFLGKLIERLCHERRLRPRLTANPHETLRTSVAASVPHHLRAHDVRHGCLRCSSIDDDDCEFTRRCSPMEVPNCGGSAAIGVAEGAEGGGDLLGLARSIPELP